MQAEPQKEHKWLEKLLGEWTYTAACPAGPDYPASEFKGSETVRSLGDLWVLCEGKGKMPDGKPAKMMMTLGYSPETQRYVGTWIGSMMTHLWVYDGEIEKNGAALALHAEGPSMAGDGKFAKYKDVIEFKSDDHRVLTSHMLGGDGKWTQIMEANYKRKKK